jgi:predicted TIM-barrel fold metal-dependent hydrolase
MVMIVDAQVHVWGASTPERPWPARAEPHRAPLGKDELSSEMAKAGVDRAVLVPPSWEGDRNDLALEAAQAHPDRYAVMGRFDPDAPGARDQVAGWKNQKGMLGMRFTFHTEVLRQPLLDGRFDWVWGEMEKAGIPAMVLFHHEYMHLADSVAERYPGLRLVMDHLGLKSGKDVTEASNFASLDKVLALAKRPNVAAKATALPCYSGDKIYPYRSLHPYIRRVYDAFGPKRMFWGTDWSRLPCSYRQGVTMFTEELPWLTAEDKEWIMGRGVCDWLGWKY